MSSHDVDAMMSSHDVGVMIADQDIDVMTSSHDADACYQLMMMLPRCHFMMLVS